MSEASSTICLSARGLINIATALDAEPITVHLGSRHYPCNRHLLRFISPKIARLLCTDPLFHDFILSGTNEESDFGIVIDLMCGKFVSLDERAAEFLIEAGHAFENSELVDLADRFLNRPIKVGNAFERIARKRRLGLDTAAEIAYAASHLVKIDTEVLKTLDLPILREIFENDKLQIRNESWLFRFVCSLIEERGDEYRELLNSVLFEFLSDAEMTTFLRLISLEEISGKMWSSLSRRLALSVHTDMTKSPRTKRGFSVLHEKQEDFAFTGESFDGVFSHLTRRCGHLCESGIISVSSSGNISMPPNQLIDSTFNGYWYSSNIPNSWVMIDFGRFRLKPSAYTLRTGHFDQNSVEHLRSWVLEGSYDALNWSELDRQKNNQDLNGDFKAKTWPCKELVAFRYVRLRQTAKNHHNSHFLFLNNIELFGTMSQGDQTAASCVKHGKS
jgi:hypothetical protein